MQVAFLYYEPKTAKATRSVAFSGLISSIEFEQRLPILDSQQPEGQEAVESKPAPRKHHRFGGGVFCCRKIIFVLINP